MAHVVVVVLNFSSGVSEWTLWSGAKYAEEEFHEMNRLAGLGRAGNGDRDLGLLAVWMPGCIVGRVSVSQGLGFACRTAGSVVLHVTPVERACSPVRTQGWFFSRRMRKNRPQGLDDWHPSNTDDVCRAWSHEPFLVPEPGRPTAVPG